MKKRFTRLIIAAITLLLATGPSCPAVYAAEVTDSDVQAVITQLETIDTLQQMQNKRSQYTVKNTHYDINTTSTAVIEEHTSKRTGYETYVSNMFAARAAAQQAYDALSSDQKELIDDALVAKLDNTLPNVFQSATLPVQPSDNEYSFYTVKGGAGYGYEVSNHMVSGQIPQTFILVDSSDGKTSWTPSGKYVQGESNYEVAYCCDIETGLSYGTNYKRVNLEDSDYYNTDSAKHIRGILENSYPFVSMSEMKSKLIADGMDEEFVESLTRSDIISAVQMAVWTYANAADGAQDGLGYFASINITKNNGIYFYPLHDTNNECWDWLPGKRQRSFDSRAQYRVNNLAHYLCTLEAVEAEDDQIVISDIQVTRADLTEESSDTYQLGVYVHLNSAGSKKDDIMISVTSYSENADGTKNVTSSDYYSADAKDKYQMTITSKIGDTIKVELEGTQYIDRGVYFYAPEGGRGTSQSLVGVGSGKTEVHAEKSFVFTENVTEKGLRIHKTEASSGRPISDITFDIYDASGYTISGEEPNDEEIYDITSSAEKTATVTTDATGYASVELKEGIYLIVEQHNAEKTKAPVAPFYLSIPIQETVTDKDGTTSIKTSNIVSIYPKNEIITSEETPVTPVLPDNVTGTFSILKHDADDREKVLSGAEFKVYRPVKESGIFTPTVTHKGVKYAVEAVDHNGSTLVLTTGEDGTAVSPELPPGTYYLVEDKAPAGYYKRDDAVQVIVTAGVMTTAEPVLIANYSGAAMPETGGIGTVIFYMIGGTLVLLGICLVIRRKLHN